jgi:hypothetical protein
MDNLMERKIVLTKRLVKYAVSKRKYHSYFNFLENQIEPPSLQKQIYSADVSQKRWKKVI